MSLEIFKQSACRKLFEKVGDGLLHSYFYRGDEIPSDIKPFFMELLGFDENGQSYNLPGISQMSFDDYKKSLSFNPYWRTNLMFRIYYYICWEAKSIIDAYSIVNNVQSPYLFNNFAKFAFAVNITYSKWSEHYDNYIDCANILFKNMLGIKDDINVFIVEMDDEKCKISFDKIYRICESKFKGLYGYYLNNKAKFKNSCLIDPKQQAFIDFFEMLDELETILGK